MTSFSESHAYTPVGNWAIHVEIPTDEQFDTVSNTDYSVQPISMRAERLNVSSSWAGREPSTRYTVSGRNIKQDGELGKRTGGHRMTKEEVMQCCPQALKAVDNAGRRLIDNIRADADEAIFEINEASGVARSDLI